MIFYLIYMEIIFHVFAFNDFNVLYPIISVVFIAINVNVFCSLFSEKINKILTIIAMIFILVLYATQYVYYELIGGVFSLSSITLAGQAAEAYQNVLNCILSNWYVFLLMILPLVLLVVF